jgi:hypothetical protein
MSNEIIDAEFEIVPNEAGEMQEQEPQAPAPAPIVFDVDPALLVGEFLKDKDVSDEDSLNLDLFLKGNADGWRFKNIPAPSLEELKALEAQVSQKQSQEAVNAQALAFLAATDYVVIRAMEKGEEISPELKAERQAARDSIVK